MGGKPRPKKRQQPLQDILSKGEVTLPIKVNAEQFVEVFREEILDIARFDGAELVSLLSEDGHRWWAKKIAEFAWDAVSEMVVASIARYAREHRVEGESSVDAWASASELALDSAMGSGARFWKQDGSAPEVGYLIRRVLHACRGEFLEADNDKVDEIALSYVRERLEVEGWDFVAEEAWASAR